MNLRHYILTNESKKNIIINMIIFKHNKFDKMKFNNFLIIFFLFFSLAHSQEIEGDWYGNLKVSGMEIPLVFHIKKFNSKYTSTMDSPKQGAFNLKFNETSFEKSILKLAMVNSGIEYDGTYNDKLKIISGTFKQGAMNLTLNLTKNEQQIKITKRPQEPNPPFSYYSENIIFKNQIDNFNLSGTLTLPQENGPFPAVILINGSGPQNRDYEVFGHKPFLVIADYLTKMGIAVLRYDDRGVADSQGQFSRATSKDFTSDVHAALDFLKSRNEIDKDKIGLIGHSEGGIIAPMVAKDSKEVSFIVLLASQGLRGDKLLLLQKKLLEEKSGISESSINQSQNIFKGAYKIILESKDDKELKHILNEYFKKNLNNELNDSQLNILLQQLTTSWMKYYLKYDPAEVLEKIDIPVLSLYGENDFQVPPIENSEILRKSLEKAKNNNVQIMTLDKLNHFFQESDTGLINEYAEIEQTIAPHVLEIIYNWIIKQY